jgi:rSAM/selenodomain-associated transferase 2/rSAM/selenodomain-associated transferase 1
MVQYLKRMICSEKPGRDRLIVFGRYPLPGRTKTRLIPHLGPFCAADLQRRLTERTVEKARGLCYSRAMTLEIRFDGGSKARMRRWLGPGPVYSEQGQGDLGQRMRASLLDAFREGFRRVILVGTDIPGMQTDHLKQALDALRHHDLVLGPSTDGGYWLIGLSRFADVFQDMAWGTHQVLNQTCALGKSLGLRIYHLNPLTDLDTLEDLRRCIPHESIRRPYVSVIIPTLNESLYIERTIRAAAHGEAEVIVVDGGSTDDTTRRAIRAGARLEKSHPGRASQQNRGAAVAWAGVLLFLHADTLLPGNYVHHVFETLLDQKPTLGAFRFRTDLKMPFLRIIEFLTHVRAKMLRVPYGDQALFMRKSVFQCAGGFPEVPIAEDLFFVRSFTRHGRIRIAPAEAVTSARRWKTMGFLRTTLINQIIVLGCYLSVSPIRLARLYQGPGGNFR